MRRRIVLASAAIALAVLLLRHPLALALLSHRPAPRPDVAAEPVQTADGRAPFEHRAGGRRYRIVPKFLWDQSAHVVGDRAYRWGAAASLIPDDLALAWGPVLQPPYRGKVSYSQFTRFYFWRAKEGGLDRGTIVSHSANTHVIPATARLRRALRAVSEGDDVRLEGWLVEVEGIDDPDFHWPTSTVRDDEGAGSCETVYLTRLTVGDRVYE